MNIPPPAARSLSVAAIREIDRIAVAEFGVPSIVLMENASRGCVDLLLAKTEPETRPNSPTTSTPTTCTILCGKGNNAGDGLAMARHLDLRGVAVTVILVLGDDFSGDALINYKICQAAGISISRWPDKTDDVWQKHFESQHWLVDALLGTGANGEPRPPLDAVISLANAAPAKRFAVDTPTGFNCQTGECSQVCFQADVTGTFVASKQGFHTPAAAQVLGNVTVLDIGAPRVLVERAFANELS